MLPNLTLRRILLYGYIEAFRKDTEQYMPLWYSSLHATGIIRGNYYLRVLGAWGLAQSGVDANSIRSLTDLAANVRS